MNFHLHPHIHPLDSKWSLPEEVLKFIFIYTLMIFRVIMFIFMIVRVLQKSPSGSSYSSWWLSGSVPGGDESSDVPSGHSRGKGEVKTRQKINLIIKHIVIIIKVPSTAQNSTSAYVCNWKPFQARVVLGITLVPLLTKSSCFIDYRLLLNCPKTTWPLAIKYCSRVGKRAQDYPQLSMLLKIIHNYPC